MERKFVVLIGLIVIAMILNAIFTALELVWYIQLAPFIFVLLGYIFIVIKTRK